jgi:hypothetical protein
MVAIEGTVFNDPTIAIGSSPSLMMIESPLWATLATSSRACSSNSARPTVRGIEISLPDPAGGIIGAMPPRRTITAKASKSGPAAAAEAEPAPAEPAAAETPLPPEPPPPPMAPFQTPQRGRAGLWAGGILIVLGVFFLLSNVGLLWWWRWDVFWPLVVIALGAYLIVRRFR